MWYTLPRQAKLPEVFHGQLRWALSREPSSAPHILNNECQSSQLRNLRASLTWQPGSQQLQKIKKPWKTGFVAHAHANTHAVLNRSFHTTVV